MELPLPETNPEIAALLRKASATPTTPELMLAWLRDELMLKHPEMNAAEADEQIDRALRDAGYRR